MGGLVVVFIVVVVVAAVALDNDALAGGHWHMLDDFDALNDTNRSVTFYDLNNGSFNDADRLHERHGSLDHLNGSFLNDGRSANDFLSFVVVVVVMSLLDN